MHPHLLGAGTPAAAPEWGMTSGEPGHCRNGRSGLIITLFG
jgi:hypothetical protein